MIDERFVEVDGTRLFCRIEGQHDGPAVLLHHSLATNLHNWDQVVAVLGADYKVVRFDARGHGRSGVPDGPYDLASLAEDVVRLMDSLEINRAHFTGLSMGGMIGQVLGLEHADRLRSLVLASTTSRVPPEGRPLWDARMALVRDKGMSAVVEETIGRWFTADFVAQGGPEVLEIADMIAATPVEGFCGWGAAIKELDLTERLGAIDTPVMVMVGKDDPGTPVEAAQAIHQAIPGSELVILKQASHQAPVEQWQTFSDALKRFIGRH